jgi:hypothetical protein
VTVLLKSCFLLFQIKEQHKNEDCKNPIHVVLSFFPFLLSCARKRNFKDFEQNKKISRRHFSQTSRHRRKLAGNLFQLQTQ